MKINFFQKYHFLLFLTYVCSLLTHYFSKDVRLSRPNKKFFRVSLISHLTGFPYLLTTFSKDVRLSWSQHFFSYLAYLTSDPGFDTENDFRKGSPTRVLAKNFFHISLSWPQNRVLTPKGHPKWSPGRVLTKTFFSYLLTYLLLFPKMSDWVDLKNSFFVSRSFTTLPEFLTYLLLFRRMSGWVDLKNLFLVSRLVDFRSGIWHWKWLPEEVTYSSTSHKFFFSYRA